MTAARRVEDTLLVLQAISGPDPGDLASVPSQLDFDPHASVTGLRVGYFPGWMNEPPATERALGWLSGRLQPIRVNLCFFVFWAHDEPKLSTRIGLRKHFTCSCVSSQNL